MQGYGVGMRTQPRTPPRPTPLARRKHPMITRALARQLARQQARQQEEAWDGGLKALARCYAPLRPPPVPRTLTGMAPRRLAF